MKPTNYKMQQVFKYIQRNRQFVVFVAFIAFIKIIIAMLFSSDYQDKMFVPFINFFLSTGDNPYQYWFDNSLLPSFPYPPFMLYIESIGGLLIKLFSFAPYVVQTLLFKIPIFAADFLLFAYIIKMFPKRRQIAAIIYFSSPIIIYSSFAHAQLDLIPTALIVASIYHLSKCNTKNLFVGALLLGLAISTKTHTILFLPLAFVYIYRRTNINKAVIVMGLSLFVFVITVLPFFGSGFVNTVLFNHEQSIIIQVFFTIIDIKIYIALLLVFLLYAHFVNFININRNLLFAFTGIMFSLFLIVIPPMPGWYVWATPFITIYFIQFSIDSKIGFIVYAALNALYLMFFIFFHKTEFVDLYLVGNSLQGLKIYNELFENVIFTLIVATLVISVALFYRDGVRNNSVYQQNSPFLFGISGDSGSGKSTLLKLLCDTFNTHDVLLIEGDGDHRWKRGDENWNNITSLNPKANFLHKQAQDLDTLKRGKSVRRVEYQHDTGKFSNESYVHPKKFIILSGLHSLYLPQLVTLLDIKIYMDTDKRLKRYWKIRRDMDLRGYSKEKVIEQIDARENDVRLYIEPQKAFADLVLQYYDENFDENYESYIESKLSLILTINSEVYLEDVLRDIMSQGASITHSYLTDLKFQSIEIHIDNFVDQKGFFEKLAYKHIPNLDDIFSNKIKWQSALDGIVQLIIMMYVEYKLRS